MESVTILMAPYNMPLFLLTSSSVTLQMSSNRKVLIFLMSSLSISHYCCMIKKEKSSRLISRVLFLASKALVIYLHLLSPKSSSGLPSDIGRATLIASVYMTLQLLRYTARHVTMRLVGSYSTFSPLPYRSMAVIFFCITLPSQIAFR